MRELGDIDSRWMGPLLNRLFDLIGFMNSLLLQLWDIIALNNTVLDQINERLPQPYTTVEESVLGMSVVHGHLTELLDKLLDRVLAQMADLQQRDQTH